MGLFDIFRKSKLETEQIELGVADKIVMYLLDLIDDKGNVKERKSSSGYSLTPTG